MGICSLTWCGDEMKWCFEIKTGIEMIEPSGNLAEAYIKKSKDALEMAGMSLKAKKKDWTATTLYYCRYFILYALLQKIGIKSQNHTCTILFAKKFLRKKIDKEKIEELMQFKDERIEKQYYVAKSGMDQKKLKGMEEKTKEFFFYVLEVMSTITEEEINDVREKFIKYKKRYDDEEKANAS